MSWTDRVVTVVVSALCALQDRDQSAEVHDEMCVKLDNVASYMVELEKTIFDDSLGTGLPGGPKTSWCW